MVNMMGSLLMGAGAMAGKVGKRYLEGTAAAPSDADTPLLSSATQEGAEDGTVFVEATDLDDGMVLVSNVGHSGSSSARRTSAAQANLIDLEPEHVPKHRESTDAVLAEVEELVGKIPLDLDGDIDFDGMR
jgi:hypothetical protein